jgi:hypothetical protein
LLEKLTQPPLKHEVEGIRAGLQQHFTKHNAQSRGEPSGDERGIRDAGVLVSFDNSGLKLTTGSNGTRRAWRNSCGCWEVADDSEGPEHNFDWFLKPDYLLPIFEELTADIKVGKDARILMLGCGNSQLSEVMYDAGWMNIVNVDYSTACIEQMTQRHGEARPKMTWLEMDVMNLTFGDEEFDMVVDKGKLRERGTADGQERWSERIVTGETNPSAMLTTKGDPWVS